MANLAKKEKKLRKHILSNKKDKTAKRGLQLLQSKTHRLDKYYSKKKK
jgi:small subunit ribosomal protein S15